MRFSKRSGARCLRPEGDRDDINGYLHAFGRGTGGRRLMSDLMIATIVFAGVNVMLASILVVVYCGVYARTKASLGAMLWIASR